MKRGAWVLLVCGMLLLIVPVTKVWGAVGGAGVAERPPNMDVDKNIPNSMPLAATAPDNVYITVTQPGAVGLVYTFLAATRPISATQPVSYTWQATGKPPVTHTGGLTDTINFTWNTTGTQVITVTAANSFGTATGSLTVAVADELPLDIMSVFDVSGSTNYETNCFGCWYEVPGRDVIEYPYPGNGDFNPLNYNVGGGPYDIFWDGNIPGAAGHAVCGDPPAPLEQGGYKYSVHEAEFYSRDEPLHGWEFDQRTPGQGYWALQRVNWGSNDAYIRAHPFPTYSQPNISNYPQLQGAAYNAECFDGANLSGECWKARADALGETAPSTPPHVEYDFTVDWANDADSETHIWIRAIGGSDYSWEWFGQSPQQLNDWRESIYYQVDNMSFGGGEFDNLEDQGSSRIIVSNNDWRWVKIADGLSLANGQHTLKLYQGSSGFNLDKIVVTNNPEGNLNTAVNNSGTVIGGVAPTVAAVLSLNGGEGPEATPGSASREACNACNPMFGQTVTSAQCSCRTGPGDTSVGSYPGGGLGLGCTLVVTPTNQLNDDLFRDVEPLRSTQEAVKHLAQQIDPGGDQLGLVTFNASIVNRVKLQCLRYADAHETEGMAKCFDPTTNPISLTHVIRFVEDSNPAGGTDTSEGMREGLEELGIEVPGYNVGVTSECSTNDNDKKACDRGGAAQRVLILTTDGVPNNTVPCPSDYHWNGNYGQGNSSFDCALFYAQQAAENNVAVYIVGIGPGVYPDLLAAMATGTDPGAGDEYFEQSCGAYFAVSNLNNLNNVFDQILALARSCAQSSWVPNQQQMYLPVILKE